MLRCDEKTWSNITLAGGKTKTLEGVIGDSCELEITIGPTRQFAWGKLPGSTTTPKRSSLCLTRRKVVSTRISHMKSCKRNEIC